MKRQIKRVVSVDLSVDYRRPTVVVEADDGTLWFTRYQAGIAGWEQVHLPELPQAERIQLPHD